MTLKDRIAAGDFTESQKDQFKEHFLKLQVSYETLISDSRRMAYEKFGDFNESRIKN